MIIGKRIKESRIKKKMTQEELGKLLNVSKVTISGYETGTRNPGLLHMLKIIEILEITPNYLLGHDLNIVADSEDSYTISLAKEDVLIIKELKKYPTLYNKFTSEYKRIIERIYKNIKDYK